MKRIVILVAAVIAVAAAAAVGIRVWRAASTRGELQEAYQALQAGRYKEAQQHYRSVWSRNPDNVAAIRGLIESTYRAGEFQQVVELADQVKAVPNLPSKVTTFKAWAELKLADIQVGQRQRWSERARTSFEAAIVQDAGNPDAHAGRGMISVEQSGLDLSSPMTGFRPVGPFFEAELATAKRHLAKAVELRPGHPEASLGLMVIAHYEGRTEEAGRLFQAASRLTEPDPLLVQALITLGVDPAQAEPVKSALAGLGTVPFPHQRALQYCALGMADYLLGDLESAQRNLKTGCRNDAEFRYPGMRLHLAKVEEARGNWAAARDELEDLRKQGRFRQEPTLLFLLALNACHRGESAEMNWSLDQVERLRPHAPDVLLFRASQEPNEINRRDLYLRVLQVDSGNFLAHYNLGTIRLRLEDTQAAIADFQAALKARPDFRDGRLNLANAYRQARRYDDAVREYRAVLSAWPEMDDAKLGLALVYLEEGKREQAVELLQQVTTKGTMGAMAQLLLARGARAEGDTAEARELAQRAVNLDPSSYQARTFLGNLFIDLGQPAEAIPHFQEASKNPNHASYPDAVNGLAVAYYLQESYDKALEELGRVTRGAREWGNTAPFFVNRGNVHLRQKRYAEAEEDYTAAQDRDRASSVASYNLGVLKEAQREWERARMHYREAIRRQPAFSEAHYNLGNLYAAIQDRKSAIEEYRKATRDAPEMDAAYVNLAIQLIEGGEYQEAIEYLERASERSPGSTVIHNALAIIHLQMEDPARAEEECARSLEADPLNATARLLTGLVRMAQLRFPEAHALLSNISPSRQLDLSLRSSLGVANVEVGNVRAGVQNLENAAELARQVAGRKRFRSDAFINLAWGLLRVGEYDRAVRALDEAVASAEGETPAEVERTMTRLGTI